MEQQFVSGAMIPSSKRSRIFQSPPSKLTIHDLPDVVLTEILCRLPHIKHVIRCKVVSKNWCSLLSSPYFVCCYLRLQRDHQKPIQRAMVLAAFNNTMSKSLVLTLSSPHHHHSVLETGISNDVFSFPPCFHDRDNPKTVHGSYSLSMLTAYNDLVLCSRMLISEGYYYICNPYTKEWARLPPTPRILKSNSGPVGLICDPYYDSMEEISTGSNIKLNAEYRFKVVRLLPSPIRNALGRPEGINMEIFSSETGEWREYPSSKILCQQQDFTSFRCVTCVQGVACNGKLYWVKKDGYIFELDPLSISSSADVIDKCRLIDAPSKLQRHNRIGVCGGHLRICPDYFSDESPIIIWELRENKEDGKSEWCLIFDQVSPSEMVCDQVLLMNKEFVVLNFHPISKDIVYLRSSKILEPGYIVMCNVREKTLQMVAHFPSKNMPGVKFPETLYTRTVCPYVIPWWPTPIPRRPEYYNVTLNVIVLFGGDIFTVKVRFLTTVKNLKQELEKEIGSNRQIHKLIFDMSVLDDDERLVMDYDIKEKSVIIAL